MSHIRMRNTLTRSAPILRARFYRTSPPCLRPSDGRDPSLSQGHAAIGDNKSPQDVHSESAKSGKAANSSSPMDAASPNRQAQAQRDDTSGNKEGVGFAEQVGGASAAGSGASRKGSEEEAQAPGVWSSIKQGLGLGTGSGDVKQNQESIQSRGGGRGVTGTGTARKFSTSAVGRSLDTAARTLGATDRQSARVLPSEQTSWRTLHTSARIAEAKHNADSYLKDVNTLVEDGTKTFKVDSSSPATDVPNTGSGQKDTTQSGKYHQAGPGDPEYESLNQSQPYDKSSQASDAEKHRYGNVPEWRDDKGKRGAQSGPSEGPEGASAGGRKPEGKA
ncbi:hypothetical protein PUNSTDRAFT_147042 [Punctularia strigosozonata HHB-11173 SS5]|uniref:Uncharacterized protein n=1 Tax=Punctularia strigosozonata (strain HHB-11173) TaxID=741275 RepID=R7S148_PUNST|nr:uncharacterized protein PUNSTDRAFT_147042 [Punctularia strigosozonata HHB-11173 SS5]EIN03517.1 hypothetical protein PUNSTDRAFT_147042 [Punctularia strigosozonata HHB-11173 SS5]